MQDTILDSYEEEIHNKLQKIRYKYNYLINHLKTNLESNTQDLNQIYLDIFKLELDTVEFKLNDFIFEMDGSYPDEKYKQMEETYLQSLGEKLKGIYTEEQKKNKNLIIKTMLPMLFQTMMLTDKDSIYNSTNVNNDTN
tara:strand:+ start:237 stop:653 length:417 start_codon:yes stop_codon:yes gene_type:complete